MEPSSRSAERLITLIIPTVHHRAALFARALRYLSSSGFQCPILISDHSPGEHVGVIGAIVQQYGGLDVKLVQHSPDIHFLTRLAFCAEVAKTPYVHVHADDDFVIRESLGWLVHEMETRPDRTAAMGTNVHVSFSPQNVAILSKTAVEEAEPFDRLIAQLETYSSVLYALRRREEFIESASFAVEHCPDVQFWQYLESCMAALSGPIAVIERLHYARGVHPDKWSTTLVRDRSGEHFPYLIFSAELHPRITAFREALLLACKAKGIPVDMNAFDSGLIHLLYRGFGAMGLPVKRIARADQSQEIVSRFRAKLADATDSATIELKRIFAMDRIDG